MSIFGKGQQKSGASVDVNHSAMMQNKVEGRFCGGPIVSLARYPVQSDLRPLVIRCQHVIEGHDCFAGTNFAPLATPFWVWLAPLRCSSSPNRNHFVGFRFGFTMRTKAKSQPSEAGAIWQGSALRADGYSLSRPHRDLRSRNFPAVRGRRKPRYSCRKS